VIVGAAICLVVYTSEDKAIQMTGSLAIFFYMFLTVQKRGPFAFVCLIALLCFQTSIWVTTKQLVAQDRNYFGIIKVYNDNNINFFYHGTTLHGAQPQEEKYRYRPVTYYSPGSPISNIFAELDKQKGKQEISVLGLGVGSVACYKAPGRHYDFYEIDSDVAKFAEDEKYFTYLSGCGSPYTIILGDGRLKIAEQPDKKYDLIFLDAFSSDNIPIHIMTKEAFEIYFAKLADDGIITMNISNRFFDLRPVLVAIGKELGFTVYFKIHQPEMKKGEISSLYTQSVFAVMSKDEKKIAAYVEKYDWKPYTKDKIVRAWTDDYANILGSFISFR
jgi:spermidine synthase